MRALTVLHRWFGVAFCLFFAMWFASGAVMHWVPFPQLTEAERTAGLAALKLDAADLAPARALAAFGRNDIVRLRLTSMGEQTVYIATTDNGELLALDATTGVKPQIDADAALVIARAHAKARGLAESALAFAETADYDQWTVSNGLDTHRPLTRIALNDAAGTELYVSATTGEVVRDTTRSERIANVAGSVLHWIYPTALRKHWAAWDMTVWWLSLTAILGALGGTLLGVLRLKNFASPFSSWMKWHHVCGLACATFVLTWIVSGWLSMDHGRLFSDGQPGSAESARIRGPALASGDLRNPPLQSATPGAGLREIEWSRFGGRLIERRTESGRSTFLTPQNIADAAARLGKTCTSATVAADDAYFERTIADGAPLYRIVCGDTWWQIDGADGRIIEKLDASRRAYRWAFRALHTLDFPFLVERPALRSVLIMLLCAGGFFFSVTGVVIGWRRLKTKLV